jgi:hypothetical protein
MNPIKLQEYNEYKETKKQKFQWHEFLKLDRKQYLNFRVSITGNI